jgi:hypothetical protein
VFFVIAGAPGLEPSGSSDTKYLAYLNIFYIETSMMLPKVLMKIFDKEITILWL